MKRFFISMCAVALCVVMVACSGDNVQSKYKYFEKEIAEALENDNDAKGERITTEFLEWYVELSKADKRVVDDLIMDSDEEASMIRAFFTGMVEDVDSLDELEELMEDMDDIVSLMEGEEMDFDTSSWDDF